MFIFASGVLGSKRREAMLRDAGGARRADIGGEGRPMGQQVQGNSKDEENDKDKDNTSVAASLGRAEAAIGQPTASASTPE